MASDVYFVDITPFDLFISQLSQYLGQLSSSSATCRVAAHRLGLEADTENHHLKKHFNFTEAP